MPEANLFALFTDALAGAGIQYMVTGSVASIVYGEPRLTHDVDLVLVLSGDAAVTLFLEAFPDEEFYKPPPEVVRAEMARALRGHFNLIHHQTGYKADIYLLSRDPLHQWAFQNRREIEVDGTMLSIAPPEYVIARKLEYYREGGSQKHLDDIAGIMRVSGDAVDKSRVSKLAQERGLEALWAMNHDPRPEGL